MEECDKCLPSLNFRFNYKPVEFISGRENSPIWIIGLNPKMPKDEELYQYDLHRTRTNLENYFSEPGMHEYFKDFEKVSQRLYSLLGKEYGVASTDIVKCYSKQFPPENCTGKQIATIINNCQPYLEQQLIHMKPKLIICNGAGVCEVIRRIVIPMDERETSYFGEFSGNKIAVVLSGFIGRIDNYAKRRLGREIEKYMEEIGIVF